MAAGSTNVVVKFLADISDMAGGIKGIDDKMSTLGGKLKGWAKGVGLALGGAFAVDQVKEWVSAASELQDAMAASEQIFGAAAGRVAKFADSAATGFGMSKQQAIEASNTFATFGKGAGLAGDDLAGFSTDLTGLAGDLASFRGTTPEQAIQAIGAALRGETEPIRAYGVLLDDATLRQRALSMGLIKTTKDALTPQQKVLAAQAEIFAQTGDAQGDFARTSDSAANQQKTLKAELENTQASLGTALLPVLQMILPVLTAFAGFIKENADWLVPLTAAVLGVAAAVWVWNAAMAANPIMQVVIVIALLVAGIILLWKNWDTIWGWITAAVEWAVGFIVDHWQMIIGIIFPFIGALMLLWNNWDTIWHWITGLIQWVVGFILSIFQTVIDFFRQVPGWIGDALSVLGTIIMWPFQWAWDQITNLWNGITGFFSKIPGWVGDALSGLGDIIKAPFQWGWDRIVEIKDGIVNTFSGIGDAISGGFREAWNFIARGWNNSIGSLSFSIPDWVPGIGGKGFEVPKIPYLAKGGIVTAPTLALLGERGPEAVVPLSHTAGAAGDVYITVNTGPLGADAPAVQSAVVAALRQYQTRNGPVPIRVAG